MDTATLSLNGVIQATNEITLDSGQSQQIVFTVTENTPGHYVVQIGDLSGDFLSFLWINWWLSGGVVAALILLGWLVWYYVRRKQLSAQSG